MPRKRVALLVLEKKTEKIIDCLGDLEELAFELKQTLEGHRRKPKRLKPRPDRDQA